MSSNLIQYPKPETPATANPWITYGQSLAPRSGDLLQFKKGDWILGFGQDAIDIEIGTTAIAVVPDNKVGWQNFQTSQSIFVPALEWTQLPTRRALGDNDSAFWNLGTDGKPKDPWQYVHTMPMMDLNGAACTFSTSSRGGTEALGNLITAYGKAIKGDKAGQLPKVALRIGSYVHKDYGKIKTPLFEIVGWVGEAPALAIESGARCAADIIDDEIPF